MKKLLMLALLLPSIALAQYHMNVQVSVNVPWLKLHSSSNPNYIVSMPQTTASFIVTGFPTLLACQMYNPFLDFANFTFDGLPVPLMVTGFACQVGP